MIFEKVSIQNFLSIKQVDLVLRDRGLVMLNGKNMDNPSLNNNGAGKSSILEAIIYALYGKTIRGLKGDAVINNKSGRNTKVFLDLIDDDGSKYRIARYRKHSQNKNKCFLYKDGVDITPASEAEFEEYITKLLQADYNTFTSSLLYSAESFKFTTATDSEIKQTFDTMLNLEVLSDCRTVARSLLTVVSSKLDGLRANKKGCEQRIVALEGELLGRQTSEKDWLVEHQSKIQYIQQSQQSLQEKDKAMRGELSAMKDESADIQAYVERVEKTVEQKKEGLRELDEVKNNILDCKSSIKEVELSIKGCNFAIKENEVRIKAAQNEIKQSQSKIDGLNKKCQDLDNNLGQPCPVCGKPLDVSSIDKAKQEYLDGIASLNQSTQVLQQEIQQKQQQNGVLQDNLKEHQKKHQSLTEKLSKYQETLSESSNLQESCDKAEKKLSKAITQLHNMEIDITSKKSDIKHNLDLMSKLDQDLQQVHNEVNPYTGIVLDTQTKLNNARKELEGIEKNIMPLESKHECLTFWEKAYSNQGIKSFILDDITPFLNRRVNKYLSKLTSNQIEVVFSTRTTLKTGESREKFSIDIVNHDGGGTYSANSGGEKKRIDLAINLALQDLVASRSSKKIDLAIFDEVFDSLDENGIDGVISLLQELSQSKSTILVVSHNEYLKSYFTNIVTVVKQDGCSRLEQIGA